LFPLLLDVAFVASSSFSISFFEELELKLEFKEEGMIDPFAIFAINAIPFSLVVSSSLAISPSRSLSSTDIAFNLLLLLLFLFFKELEFPEGGVVVDPLEDATSIVLAFPANVRIARMFALIEDEEEEDEFDPHILLLLGLSERWSEADIFFSSSLMFASLVVAFGGAVSYTHLRAHET